MKKSRILDGVNQARFCPFLYFVSFTGSCFRARGSAVSLLGFGADFGCA